VVWLIYKNGKVNFGLKADWYGGIVVLLIYKNIKVNFGFQVDLYGGL
jgi:hypothetical protein